MPGLTRFPKPQPSLEEQLLEILKRLEAKIDELIKKSKSDNEIPTD